MFHWILPPVQGQKVILNPEAPNYERYNRMQAKNRTGIITSVDSGRMTRWERLNQERRADMLINVTWNEKDRYGYSAYQLLPIDDYADIIHVRFEDGIEKILPVNETTEKYLDEHIIKSGLSLIRKELFDQSYREKVYQHLYSQLNKRSDISEYHAMMISELNRLGIKAPKSTEESVIEQLIDENESIDFTF